MKNPRARLAELQRAFIAESCGATAIEYGMIAAGVGLTVATVVWNVGSTLKANFYDAIAAML